MIYERVSPQLKQQYKLRGVSGDDEALAGPSFTSISSLQKLTWYSLRIKSHGQLCGAVLRHSCDLNANDSMPTCPQ